MRIINKHSMNLTPKEIVKELDNYIIGQEDAKKSVAIALRTRWRRQQLSAELAEEVLPKNILMIGPTGVGKTEIARRLSKLADAPFIKVEASKYTEVGYVGRDVESMIRDLTSTAVHMVKESEAKRVRPKAKKAAMMRLVSLLLPHGKDDEPHEGSKNKIAKMLEEKKLDNKMVELKSNPSPSFAPAAMGVFGGNIDEISNNLQDMLSNLMPSNKPMTRKVSVKEAYDILTEEEINKMLDQGKVNRIAKSVVEESGIVFIDEIDKIINNSKGGSAPDISREGVQRDLLPIVEGTSVSTKYGVVKTDHILFIAAGAFHISKPSDIIPELQGRFPIRVELNPLDKESFKKILTLPKNALIKQYIALIDTESVDIEFSDDAIDELSNIAVELNQTSENIGARRLYTLLEKVLEEISFNASDMRGQKVKIGREFVKKQLEPLMKSKDLREYIL